MVRAIPPARAAGETAPCGMAGAAPAAFEPGAGRAKLPSFLMVPVRRLVPIVAMAASVLAAWGAAPLRAAQAPAHEGDELALHAYTLRYQQAIEAIPLIQPLLSSRGTLELQPSGNTVVIRDTNAALARILPKLRAFDHPAQPVRVDVLILHASRTGVSQLPRTDPPPVARPATPATAGAAADLPEGLIRRLREMLPYESYELQAQAQLGSQEGQSVVYNLGEDYEVSFRVGTLLEARRIKLSNFEVSRRTASRRAAVPLVHTSLNLGLDQTMSLGLAHSEASRDALIIVVTVHQGEPRPRGE